jgi:hypothetical protein
MIFGRTKIRSFDPALTSVWTSYPARPLLAFLDPPIECATWLPQLRSWGYLPSISVGVLSRIEIHT